MYPRYKKLKEDYSHTRYSKTYRLHAKNTYHPLHGFIKNSMYAEFNSQMNITYSSVGNSNNSGNYDWLCDIVLKYEQTIPNDEYEIVPEVKENGIWVSVDFMVAMDELNGV